MSLIAGVKARQRLTSGAPDLQRSLNALTVRWCQTCGSGRVDLGQLRMQRCPALVRGFGVNGGAHLRVGGRNIVDAVDQCLEVQHGAAYQQADSAAAVDVVDQRQCVAHEFCGTIRFARAADVEQVVGNAGLLLQRGLGCAYIHTAVDQGGVHADDLHRQLRRKLMRQCNGSPGFARCSGASQTNA